MYGNNSLLYTPDKSMPLSSKGGDTAVWRVDGTLHHPHPCIAYNCNPVGKLLQGIAENFLVYKEAYVSCEFQQKVERE